MVRSCFLCRCNSLILEKRADLKFVTAFDSIIYYEARVCKAESLLNFYSRFVTVCTVQGLKMRSWIIADEACAVRPARQQIVYSQL